MLMQVRVSVSVCVSHHDVGAADISLCLSVTFSVFLTIDGVERVKSSEVGASDSDSSYTHKRLTRYCCDSERERERVKSSDVGASDSDTQETVRERE